MMKSLLLFSLERLIIKKYLVISQSKDPMKLDNIISHIYILFNNALKSEYKRFFYFNLYHIF